MHPLDQALELQPAGPGVFRASTHPDYANMVGPFGGTTAAQLLQAAWGHPERLGEPVALTVNFAAPLADGPMDLHARALRTNRSTQHWLIEARQADATVASATVVFALRRQTWSATEARMPQDLPLPETLQRMPIDGLMPWPKRYDMRFIEGPFPEFDGQEQAHSRSCLWVRDEPSRALDFAALAAMSDSFFPRIYVRRRQRVPIGTVTLTTYFHADSALLARVGQRHVLGVARALNFRKGYFDQSGELWSPEGDLLASTHQLVYFKD